MSTGITIILLILLLSLPQALMSRQYIGKAE